MLEKYKQYLDTIDLKILKFFIKQKPYIFCKEGCSLCCKNGQYPYTELEFNLLKEGFNELSSENKKQIKENIKRLKEKKSIFTGESSENPFIYDCPMLVDNKCSVYVQRGLVCRAFGLPYYNEDGTIKLPGCVYQGLNYASVYDVENKILSQEMYKKTGFDIEPLAFNLSLKFLINNEGVKYLGLRFGEQRALIDWF